MYQKLNIMFKICTSMISSTHFNYSLYVMTVVWDIESPMKFASHGHLDPQFLDKTNVLISLAIMTVFLFHDLYALLFLSHLYHHVHLDDLLCLAVIHLYWPYLLDRVVVVLLLCQQSRQGRADI
jgi:hypothetical protein